MINKIWSKIEETFENKINEVLSVVKTKKHKITCSFRNTSENKVKEKSQTKDDQEELILSWKYKILSLIKNTVGNRINEDSNVNKQNDLKTQQLKILQKTEKMIPVN